MTISRYTLLVVVISLLFFLIPFFWLKPGEMDLGGDSSRLYFYDPLHYLFSQSLFSVSHSAFGGESLSFFAIPFFLFLAFFKSILQSPTTLISAFHGFSLSVAFLSCYLIIKELLKGQEEATEKHRFAIEIASILGGFFYTLSPIPIRWWGYPILTFNQVFVSPLMFFLLLRFLLTQNIRYMLTALLVSLLFAPNFSYIGAPTFFAFYPLAIAFLLLYTKFVRVRKLPVKKIAIGVLLFFLIHAFHQVPQIVSLLTPGSLAYETVFTDQGKVGRLAYFSAIAPSVKVTYNVLGLLQLTKPESFSWIFIVFPLVLALGFFWNKSKNKAYLLTGIFFLITLYFVSANITNIGLKLYGLAFQLPGFSMFRNFYGQWQWSNLFFYALLFGQALFIILVHIKKFPRYILVGFFVILFVTTSWPFMNGTITDTTFWQSKNIKSHVEMDPNYEEVLSYIRSLPVDGKVLSLPLDDHGYQVLKGKNEAAYGGPSTITYLTNKNEFKGYDEFGEFGPTFLTFARDKNYIALKNIFAMFNIKYIFYNSDPFIYGENFPAFPYDHIRKFLPSTQEGYKEFIKNLGVKEIKTIAGKYHIYEVDNATYLPHIYVADKRYYVNQTKNDILFTLLFNLPDQRLALYSPQVGEKFTEKYDWIFLKAKDKTPYADALPKATHPSTDKELKPLDDKVQELTDENVNWQEIFAKYTELGHNLIKEKKNNNDYFTTLANQVKINQMLNIHEINISKILLSYRTKSYQEKISLALLADKSFDQLKDELNLSIPEPSMIGFSLDIPLAQTYQVYSTKDIIGNFGAKGEFVIDNKKLLPHKSQVIESLLRFEDVHIGQGKNKSVVIKNLEFPNIIEKTLWHSLDGTSVDPATTTFTLNDIIGNKNGLFSQIDFKPGTLYFVSFDYLTYGKNFWVNLYEIVNNPLGNPSMIANQLSADSLRSKDWKTYRAVIRTGEDPNAALLVQIFPRDEKVDYLLISNTPDKIQVKNLSAAQIPQPQIILKNLQSTKKIPESLPDITFTKINPARYEVKVKNAKNPYTLIFLQTFNKNWKIIDPEKLSKNILGAFERGLHTIVSFIYGVFTKEDINEKIAGRYFNEDILEGVSHDAFFNKQTLVTFGKATVAQDRHFVINGYANAWDITPEDFNGKTDYTLIIEMASQQLFYISLLVSFIVFVSCGIWLTVLGYKNLFKKI